MGLYIELSPFLSNCASLFYKNPYPIPWYSFHHKCVLKTWYMFWGGRIGTCSRKAFQAFHIIFHMLHPCANKWWFRNTHPTPLLQLFFIFGRAFLRINLIRRWWFDLPPRNALITHFTKRLFVDAFGSMRLRPPLLSFSTTVCPCNSSLDMP